MSICSVIEMGPTQVAKRNMTKSSGEIWGRITLFHTFLIKDSSLKLMRKIQYGGEKEELMKQ